MSRTPPRPLLRDHLRVAWLLVVTLLGAIPVVLWVIGSPILKPLVRVRLTRRLRDARATAGAPPPAPDPRAWAGRTVFVVAGEPSGDRLAAEVVAVLKRRCPEVTVRGYAGPATAAAGAELDRDLVDHAVVGVSAVVRSLGFWWGVCVETLARLRDDPPDVFLTVDFPGLNGRLARWARRRGVTTVHLVPPAVWAYMPWRLGRWRRAVDRMLTVFPHETALYAGAGVPCTFVGHPLFKAPLDPARTPPERPAVPGSTIELYPGSRRHEIHVHAPIVLDAAARIERALPDVAFVVRCRTEVDVTRFEEAARDVSAVPRHLAVRVGQESSDDAPLLGALAKSGTITAELGASLVPHAVFYRLSPLARFGAMVGLTSPFVALSNLIAGRRVVPERLQVGAGGGPAARNLLDVLESRASWAATREHLRVGIRERVAVENPAERAAWALCQEFDQAATRRSSSRKA